MLHIRIIFLYLSICIYLSLIVMEEITKRNSHMN